MRLATFNIETLDLPPRSDASLNARASVLRPLLQRLDADVLCLQEVNAQHVQGAAERQLVALDRLLAGTHYETFARAVSSGHHKLGPADVHNLVTLSRHPITRQRQVLHDYVAPPLHQMLSGAMPGSQPIRFERPLLLTEIGLPSGDTLVVVNLHLRAPLASAIGGEKQGPFAWRSVGGWAEGYYLSALKRSAQALELRLLVDEIFSTTAAAKIAVAGDFNAEDHEVPIKLCVAANEDTGNSELARRSLVVLDRALPDDRRWSVLHHGRPQMLDHVLASRSLYGHFRGCEIYNEALEDEAVGHARSVRSAGSYHAPLIATFAF